MLAEVASKIDDIGREFKQRASTLEAKPAAAPEAPAEGEQAKPPPKRRKE